MPIYQTVVKPIKDIFDNACRGTLMVPDIQRSYVWTPDKIIRDALHSISCAAGYNLRWLMRAIARLGIVAVFLRLLQAMLSGQRGTQTVAASMIARGMAWTSRVFGVRFVCG